MTRSSEATPPRRTRLSPEARRAQLIALGLEMLATRTLDELSVEDLAAQAGISRGLLFHYFASKQDFHIEVARAAAAEMIRRTEPDPSLPPVEALRAALAAYVSYVEENPDNYKSLVRGAASGDAEMRAIFDATRDRMAARITDVVTGLGLAMSGRADLAVHGWVAFAEECVVRWIADGGGADGGGAVGAGGETSGAGGAVGVGRGPLLDLLTATLPAVVLAATDGDLDAVAALLTAGRPAG